MVARKYAKIVVTLFVEILSRDQVNRLLSEIPETERTGVISFLESYLDDSHPVLQIIYTTREITNPWNARKHLLNGFWSANYLPFMVESYGG